MSEKKSPERMKSLVMAETCNMAQFALQGYDKSVISREELSLLMGIDLDTGGITKDWGTFEYYQTLLQCYDKQLITEDVLRKQVYDLEPRNVVISEEEDK